MSTWSRSATDVLTPSTNPRYNLLVGNRPVGDTSLLDQAIHFVEIVNRLKRGTQDGKLLWEHTGTLEHEYVTPLESGHRALVARAPHGQSVILTMSNGQVVQTLYLDSSRVDSEILRLALLQLFVAVRDTLVLHATTQALDAVKGL